MNFEVKQVSLANTTEKAYYGFYYIFISYKQIPH